MPAGWVAAAAAAAGVVGSVVSSDAARSAANKQQDAANAGIAQQNSQFSAIQQLLAPYNAVGNQAVTAQGNLAGLNGAPSQQAAIDAIKNGPAYTSALQAGNDNILAKASATGGLRGGNVQAALGQFAPALLSQSISDQYARLGGLTSIGQNAAAGVGNAGMATGNQITGLLGQLGQSQAGNALAQGNAGVGALNGVASGLGSLAAQSGFGGSGYNQYSMFGGYSANPNPGSADFMGVQGGGGGDFSDVRLKTNIKRIGTTKKGNGIYTWDWKTGGSGRGVLAQEVARNSPEAVHMDPDGILKVDYAREL